MGTVKATFEQWLEFVFNNPVRKREWYWDEDFDSRWEALELTDALIVQHMTRLFLEPAHPALGPPPSPHHTIPHRYPAKPV